jgi:hypothetical protein
MAFMQVVPGFANTVLQGAIHSDILPFSPSDLLFFGLPILFLGLKNSREARKKRKEKIEA